MEFEDSSLSGGYDLVTFGVAGGTRISSRTSAVVGKLSTNSSDGETKSTVVALTAASKAAGKLISIVEIAKRELVARGFKVYQYNALSSRMTEIPRRTKRAQDGEVPVAANAEASESDDAFEAMGAVQETGTKKRNVPLMTVYLSTASVKELKTAFGYGCASRSYYGSVLTESQRTDMKWGGEVHDPYQAKEGTPYGNHDSSPLRQARFQDRSCKDFTYGFLRLETLRRRIRVCFSMTKRFSQVRV